MHNQNSTTRPVSFSRSSSIHNPTSQPFITLPSLVVQVVIGDQAHTKLNTITPIHRPQTCRSKSRRRTSAMDQSVLPPPPQFLPHAPQLILSPLTENPQNPHHPDIAKSAVSRKGLHRAPRARQVQEPSRQGSRPSPNQDPQSHHPKDALR